MSIYPKVTEEDLNNLSRLAEQQRNQRVPIIRKKKLKQTHEKNVAKNFDPITKKLENVIKSPGKKQELFEKTNSENEKQKDIGHIEIASDNSENENDNIESQ